MKNPIRKFWTLLTMMACCAPICSFLVMAAEEAAGEQRAFHKVESLKELYKDEFLIGSVFNPFNLEGVDRDMLLYHFNAVTPENMMKPDAMQKEQGQFTFDQADFMVDFSQNNGLSVAGHTLTWHSQTPDWMTAECDRTTAIEILKEHISNVAGHYKGKLISWDVVNEAIADGAKLPEDGNWRSCLRDTPWLRNIGDDYIELAFQFAKEADPDAKLYYNDYNLNNPDKTEIAAAMFSDFKQRGIPIDGIGMQSHYNTNLSLGTVENAINKFREAGAVISVTELDVSVSGAADTGLTEEQEIAQAQTYAQLFQLYKNYSDVIERVTFWGYDDSHSWRSSQYPCLFNGAAYSPKAAYYAVANPAGYLENYPLKNIPEPKTLRASKGTPTIDGTVDEMWSNALEGKVDTMTMAWQGATATVLALWDEHNIYVLIKVTDGMLNDSSVNAHEQDSVEIFLDEDNDKSDYYQAGDGQYRVSYKNEVSSGSTGLKEGFLSAAVQTEDGYLVEMKIPVERTLEVGMLLGFDAQVNDSNDRGERISVAKFNDDTDNSWQSTARWGIMQLN